MGWDGVLRTYGFWVIEDAVGDRLLKSLLILKEEPVFLQCTTHDGAVCTAETKETMMRQSVVTCSSRAFELQSAGTGATR
jgi:hypothetical protein